MAVTAAASRRPGPGAAGAVAGQSPSEAGIHQQVLSSARCAAVCVMLTSVDDLQVPLWIPVTQWYKKLGPVKNVFFSFIKLFHNTFYIRMHHIIRRKVLFSVGHRNIGVMGFLFGAHCNQLIAFSVTPPTEERMTYGSRKGRFHTCRFLFGSSCADIDPERRKRFFPPSFSQLLVVARTLAIVAPQDPQLWLSVRVFVSPTMSEVRVQHMLEPF